MWFLSIALRLCSNIMYSLREMTCDFTQSCKASKEAKQSAVKQLLSFRFYLLTNMSYELLDSFYTFLHLAIIGFNLFGWIWRRTRKAHLVVAGLTLASWFILGIWYGWGYCPITDWQWQVKEKLGETSLPASFVKYFADKITGRDFSPSLVEKVTLFSFLLAIALSIYVNFRRRTSAVPRR
jgi:hypothetical protein